MLTLTVHDYILMVLNHSGRSDVRQDCLGAYAVMERETESSSNSFSLLVLLHGLKLKKIKPNKESGFWSGVVFLLPFFFFHFRA